MESALDREIEGMIEVASEASDMALDRYREHLATAIEVEHKASGEPVTAADRAIDAFVTAELGRRFPEAAVIGEESVPREPAELSRRLRARRVFFVDPIDGTQEFVARTGEFAVMIGLAVDGAAEAGVVAIPTEATILAGRVGQLAVALCDGRLEQVRVSGVDDFAHARMMVSRSHRPAIIEPLCRRLGLGRLEPCGSVGVKVARLAMGKAELYVHLGRGVKRWDTCAPEAILQAAGGRFTDFDGAAIDYRAGDLRLGRGLVATNGILHPGVLSACGWAEQEARRLGRGSN